MEIPTTTKTIAAELGITTRRVQQIVADLSLQNGYKVGRARIFSDSEKRLIKKYHHGRKSNGGAK